MVPTTLGRRIVHFADCGLYYLMVNYGRRWGKWGSQLLCASNLDRSLLSQILSHVKQMLSRRDKSLKDIVKTLQVYYENVDEDRASSDASISSQRDILAHLMTFLNGS